MATAIIALVVLLCVAMALRKIILDKVQHKSSCGCGCDHCPSEGICHPPKNENN